MKINHLKNMVRGWFIGNFEPSLYKTENCEIAVKEYNAGDYEEAHYHKIATEFTVIISGKVLMNGIEYHAGDIIEISPLEITNFKCLENGTINVVVKIPSVKNDKYIVDEIGNLKKDA